MEWWGRIDATVILGLVLVVVSIVFLGVSINFYQSAVLKESNFNVQIPKLKSLDYNETTYEIKFNFFKLPIYKELFLRGVIDGKMAVFLNKKAEIILVNLPFKLRDGTLWNGSRKIVEAGVTYEVRDWRQLLKR